MNRDLLYKITIGGMFLIGGLGIGVFLFSLFFFQNSVSNPPSIVEETVGQSQLSQTPIPKVPQAVPQKKETSNTPLDTDSHLTEPSVSTEEEESVTAQPPSDHSSEDPIAAKIRKLEAQYEEHKAKFSEKFRTQQEFADLLTQHNDKGRRELIEELKQLQKLQIEAHEAGLHDKANEIKARSRQVNEDYGRHGKELVDTINAIGEETDVIAKQMVAIQAELESLKGKRQGEGL